MCECVIFAFLFTRSNATPAHLPVASGSCLLDPLSLYLSVHLSVFHLSVCLSVCQLYLTEWSFIALLPLDETGVMSESVTSPQAEV